MNVGIIGAGRVGCAFAIGLDRKGVKISSIYNRSAEGQSFLCERLAICEPNDLNETLQKSDILFITVPDAEVECVVKKVISVSASDSLSGKFFFHTSGALDSDALNLVRWQGGIVASLHPIQTFADKKNGWEGLSNIYFGFEGAKEAKSIAKKIVALFDSHMIVVQKENKPLYHATACILSNYVVTLSYIAESLFASAGLQPDDAIKAYLPLLLKTISNVSEMGSIQALTGPIARGDHNTVFDHIKVLEKVSHQYVQVYKELAKITVEMAVEKGSLQKHSAESILALVGEAE